MTNIHVLDNMHMQPTVCCLQFEIGHGVVKLDIDQALSDRLVYLGALVTLEFGIE